VFPEQQRARLLSFQILSLRVAGHVQNCSRRHALVRGVVSSRPVCFIRSKCFCVQKPFLHIYKFSLPKLSSSTVTTILSRCRNVSLIYSVDHCRTAFSHLFCTSLMSFLLCKCFQSVKNRILSNTREKINSDSESAICREADMILFDQVMLYTLWGQGAFLPS
jgi:hypothetical protein